MSWAYLNILKQNFLFRVMELSLTKWGFVEKPLSSFGLVGAYFVGEFFCGSPHLWEEKSVGEEIMWGGRKKVWGERKVWWGNLLPSKLLPTFSIYHPHFSPPNPHFYPPPQFFFSHKWGEPQIIFPQNRLPPFFSPQMRKRCTGFVVTKQCVAVFL